MVHSYLGRVHSLPPGDTGRGFPFSEDETRRHFLYLSINLMTRVNYIKQEYSPCIVEAALFISNMKGTRFLILSNLISTYTAQIVRVSSDL